MSDVLASPAIVAIATRGGEFVASPVRMGKLAAFTAAAMPMIGDILAVMDGDVSPTTLLQHEKPLFEMVSICTGLNQDQYDDFLPDDYLALVGAVVEVNADFFVQKLLPTLSSRIDSIKSKVATAMEKATIGTMPSSA